MSQGLSKQELIKKMHEMAGAVKAFKMASSFIDAARYSLIKQIKDSKAYKTLGMDWKGFCSEVLGSTQNTVNTEMKLLEDYGESFLKVASKMGLNKRDLNALGSGLPDDAKAKIRNGVVQIGDREFKIDEIGEDIDEFAESLAELSKQHQEAAAQLKAERRVNTNNHKTIDSLHGTIARLKEREEKKKLGAVEAAFLKKMETLRTGFDGYMLKVDPERMAELAKDKDPTVRMRVAYLETVGYMHKQLSAALAMGTQLFGDPTICPEEKWEGPGA